jgi:hypothetical protein
MPLFLGPVEVDNEQGLAKDNNVIRVKVNGTTVGFDVSGSICLIGVEYDGLGNLTFTDVFNPSPVTLSQLLVSSLGLIFDNTGVIVIDESGEAVVK